MNISASVGYPETSLQAVELGQATEFGPEASVRPSSLLAAVAERAPDRKAFKDQPDRETWSGRPRIEWSYRNTARVVARLATFFQSLQLPSGAAIGNRTRAAAGRGAAGGRRGGRAPVVRRRASPSG